MNHIEETKIDFFHSIQLSLFLTSHGTKTKVRLKYRSERMYKYFVIDYSSSGRTMFCKEVLAALCSLNQILDYILSTYHFCLDFLRIRVHLFVLSDSYQHISLVLPYHLCLRWCRENHVVQIHRSNQANRANLFSWKIEHLVELYCEYQINFRKSLIKFFVESWRTSLLSLLLFSTLGLTNGPGHTV